MLIIDVNTSFGHVPGGGQQQPLEVLRREMSRNDVSVAATCSLKGIYHHYAQGNDDTLCAAKAHADLLPVAVLNPKQMGGHEDEIDQCLREGFRLFRFYPEAQGWDPECLPFQHLMERLAGRSAVIQVVAGGWGSVTRLARATADYDLPTIILGVHYSQLPESMEAMARYPHLYAETHRLASDRALVALVRRVGEERVLFGSGAPEKPLPSALNVVWFAALTDSQRQAIFGGNAVRLLGESIAAQPPPASVAPPALPPRIFDVHAHFGAWGQPGATLGAEDTLKAMEKYHVNTRVLSSSLGVRYDYAEGNRELQEAIAGHPSLLGYVVVDPNDLAGSCEEMDRYFQLEGFVGAKLHCQYTRQPTESRAVRALVAEVARRGRPLLIHNGGSNYVAALLGLARAHPGLKMIAAHAGPGRPDPVLIAAAAEVGNLYLEFCTTYPWRGAVRAAIESVGAERILFGSDFPILDPGYVLGHYYDAGLSASEEEKIMYSNARDLFAV